MVRRRCFNKRFPTFPPHYGPGKPVRRPDIAAATLLSTVVAYPEIPDAGTVFPHADVTDAQRILAWSRSTNG
ncbi:hypothetical protein B586_01930 [Mycobacterium haemophilum DSM 44634]|uniref:Uncharacterized protein n=1 Tax=Mycobacterium haemophilum TaxID=29311 RepID=A0A0I9TR61_9MYCO|nr:hypothetical protein B586_01930 [Mycobacterium haemophilum DSM 44634]KLO32244.1 hypothetical protein ABH39_07915 [Mycobacterium haemophilum]KLO36651.1 hypothetical protein ABH38_11830 [Mycobacterium haemophilum]KLO42579.1 hypothetical protein ABH37_10460 [Mycobacterium haemophilum]KLO55455.1 hypothetical protein ABH36_07435 [Mycobacterium haemophilum]